MKFKIDENLPVEAAPIIRQAGHDATTMLDQRMSGISDPDGTSRPSLLRVDIFTIVKGIATQP